MLLTYDNAMFILMTVITAGNCLVGAGAMNLDHTRWLIPVRGFFVAEVSTISGLMLVAIVALRWYWTRRGALLQAVKIEDEDAVKMGTMIKTPRHR
jgi:hypothetical protein